MDDVVLEELAASCKTEEVKTLAPALEDASLVAAVLDESPRLGEGKHRHDVRRKLSGKAISTSFRGD